MRNLVPLFLIILTSLFTNFLFSQITVTSTQTPNNLVQNVLLGNGVTATNISYNGSLPNASVSQSNVTQFAAGATSFPISAGVLLTTGVGSAAVGPNSSSSFTLGGTPNVSSDPDLVAISSASVTNGGILEFDFVPAGDTIRFRYLFGSDEYPEFSPSTFNDAFGFFLSGPGIAGPFSNGAINIAVIPGTTTAVTINNVGPTSNVAYYVNNNTSGAYGNAIQYDGTTVVLTAVAQVQCGQTYHIKLAIANVGDQSYDSGVFIEADSFSSESVDVTVATVSGDSTVVEGCTDASFIFTRPTSQSGDTLVVNYALTGSAIEGTDYNNLPSPITFLPGDDTITITLTPFQDGIIDGPDTVIISVQTITQCGDTIITTGTLYILDSLIVTVNETDVSVPCSSDSVAVSATGMGGQAPYTYSWSYLGQTTSTAYVPSTMAPGSIDYYVTATDGCGFIGRDTVTVTLLPPPILDISETDVTVGCFTDSVPVSATASGGFSPYSYAWNFASQVGSNAFVPSPDSIGVLDYLVTATDICGYTFTDTVTITFAGNTIISIAETDATLACPSDSVAVSALASGGFSPYTYSWDFASQTGTNAFVPSPLSAGSLNYVVIATDICGFAGTDTVTVTLSPPPIISINETDITISCPSSNVTVSAVASGGFSPYSYSWNFAGLSGSSINVPSTTTAGSINYIVTATDVCGYTGSDTVTVTLLPPPTITITETDITLACPSSSVTVSAVANGGFGPYSYSWNFGGLTGTSITVPSNPTPGGSVNYIVTATDNCGYTAIDTVTIIVSPPPTISVNENDPNVACPNDSVVGTAIASGGNSPYAYSWNFAGQTGTSVFLPTTLSNGVVNYIVTVTDFCGYTQSDTVTVTLNQTLIIDSLSTTPTSSCAVDGSVSAFVSGITGTPIYSWVGTNQSGTFTSSTTTLGSIPPGTYYFTVTDAVCNASDSIAVTLLPTPNAQFSANDLSGCAPFNVIFTNTSQNASNFNWIFDNGNTLNTTSTLNQSQVFIQDATVMLIATLGICSDTATLDISVITCGCTDPQGLNYNPLAVSDDGSCQYPEPIVEIPNVYTPNGDGTNDGFSLNAKFVVDIEMTIVNRWGNVVFKAQGPNPVWLGNANGDPVSDGVYFVIYTVTGVIGQKVTGQGYVQIFRN